MDLDTLIVTVFCLLDDLLVVALVGLPVRQRGPLPLLSDSEVLTIEALGFGFGLGSRHSHLRLFSSPFRPLLSRLAEHSSHDLCPSGGQPLANQREALAASVARGGS